MQVNLTNRPRFSTEEEEKIYEKTPKRVLFEAVRQLAALCHEDGCDDAVTEGTWVERLKEEIEALKANGII